jgi:hypothetical protein
MANPSFAVLLDDKYILVKLLAGFYVLSILGVLESSMANSSIQEEPKAKEP